MRRPALYSRSRRTPAPDALADAPVAPPRPEGPAPGKGAPLLHGAAASASGEAITGSRWLRARRHLRADSPLLLWSVIVLLALGLVFTLAQTLKPGPRKLTQEDIDAAVMRTVETHTLPSQATRAINAVAPSVVRVVSYVRNTPERAKLLREKGESRGAGDLPPGHPKVKPKADVAKPESAKADAEPEFIEIGVGTGVVIVDKGVILTNFHVINGADQVKVTFADGLEATASVIGAQPENDLAVLQAHKIPDDLVAATMRSTADLSPGDEVVAVGFPFGIGPSASAGVVSGLKRSFRSPEGKQEMKNLIQFDAAANPGNSGGPLVTMDGGVVGIVTAILNPTPARTFIGIGFAVPIENAASAVGMPPF
jgi:S1-C subfamily serine protease